MRSGKPGNPGKKMHKQDHLARGTHKGKGNKGKAVDMGEYVQKRGFGATAKHKIHPKLAGSPLWNGPDVARITPNRAHPGHQMGS